MTHIRLPLLSRTRAVLALSTLALLALAACDNRSQNSTPATPAAPAAPMPAPATVTERLGGTLDGANAMPVVNTAASGSIEGTWVTDSNTLSWTVTYSGLSGPVTGAHFHGPAAAGENGPVALPFTGNLDSPIEGTATLSPTQAEELAAGRWYVNLHTAAHPDGEIRGQVMVRP
jgi:hypothetical protein